MNNEYYILHIAHTTLENCKLYTAHYTMHIARYTRQTSDSTVLTAHCTLNTRHYSQLTTHCTLHTKQGSQHTAHCTLHTAHCTLFNCTLSHCTAHPCRKTWGRLYTVLCCTLYGAVHCTVIYTVLHSSLYCVKTWGRHYMGQTKSRSHPLGARASNLNFRLGKLSKLTAVVEQVDGCS